MNLRTVLCAVFFMPALASAATPPSLDAKFKEAYSRAEKAVKADRPEEADLWMARYMGLCTSDPVGKRKDSDLFALMEKRGLKDYTNLFNSRFDEGFKEFFFLGAKTLWDVPDNNFLPEEKAFKVKPSLSEAGDHFVIPVLKPVLQGWRDMSADKMVVAPLPLGKSMVLRTGRVLKGDKLDHYAEFPVPLGGDWSFVQYLWYPEFHDLEGDGIPELWVRYNVTIMNGFRQVLDIYRFEKGKKITLLKSFEGGTEGVARRLVGNKVEVAEGCTEIGEGHMGFEKHCFSLWEFQKGKFVKVKDWKAPHLLWKKDWGPYFKQKPLAS